MTTAFHYLAYLGLRGFEGLLRLVPLRLCGTLGATGGRLFGILARPYRQLVRHNLRLAFGTEKTEREIRQLTGRHFATLGRNLISSLKVATMSVDAVEACISYEGREHITEATRDGRGFVFAIGHFGNWEVLSQVPSLYHRPDRATMYQSLANPFINRHVVRTRSQHGTTLFDRSDGFFGPMKWIREGGGVGILFDQHAGDLGIWCPLFGRLASTTKLPALLAIKAKVAIVPGSVRTDGPGRWKIVCHPPIEPGDPAPEGIDRATHLTRQLNLALEASIRESPEDWFWVHDRWKTPQPNFLLSDQRRGIHVESAEQAAALKPFRLLVRSPNPLGDACMAIPAVRAIKRSGRPDLRLTVLCRSNLAAVWQAVEEVDEVIVADRADSPRTVAAKLKQSIAPFDYDAALVMPNSLSSVLECKFAGIPRIVGFRGHWRRWLLDDVVERPVANGPLRHHSEAYLDLARHCGAEADDVLSHALGDDETSTAARSSTRPVIGICAGAEYGEAKRWPIDRYAAAMRKLHAAMPDGCEWRLFGSPNEADLGEALAKLAADTGPLNLAGRTSLAELCDELRRCDLVISNDTGTMHLGAALGVPTIGIFGSTEPAWTAPLGEGHTVIRRHVECSPCFLRECPRDYRCMLEIDVQQVVDAALAQLQRDS